MDPVLQVAFRILAYVLFGFALEVTFAAHGIEVVMAARIPRRVPRKYLEGFVSLYMAPLHGLGLLLFVEPVHDLIRAWPWPSRFAIWAAGFTLAELGWGWIQHHLLGFFTWDYYGLSRFRIGRQGYSLWTLVPLWGLTGMIVEVYTDLVRFLAPHAAAFFLG